MSRDPLNILKELVSLNTVSKQMEESQDFRIVELVQDLLEKDGYSCEIITHQGLQHVLATLSAETETEHGKDHPRILFLGHLDTVPFDRTEWGHLDPLTLTEDPERKIAHGRGAQDCKGSVAALLSAARELREYWKASCHEGRPFSLFLAFTTDEEVGGERGAGYLARLLQEREEKPSAVINVDTTFAPTIRRRGAFNVVITSAPRWTWLPSSSIITRYQVEGTRIIQGENEGPHAAYFIAGCDVHPLISVAKHFFTNPRAWALTYKGQFLATNIIPAHVIVDAVDLSSPPAFTTSHSHDAQEVSSHENDHDTSLDLQNDDSREKINVSLTLLLRKLIPAVKTFFQTDRPSTNGITITPNMLEEHDDGQIMLVLDVRAMLASTKPLARAMHDLFGELPSTKVEIKGVPGYLFTKKEDPLVQALLRVLQKKGFQMDPVERGGATDSRFFSPMGIPCVEIGVNGGNVHGPLEFVDLKSLEMLPSIYVELVKEYVKTISPIK